MKNIFLVFLVFLPVVVHGQKNSQWRGEGRDGLYHETGLLKVWPAEGPQLLWKYEGLGEGYTSVAIANEKVYITGLDDEKLVLFVFDLTGKLLTRNVIGKEWTKNYKGPRCTVSVNDGKLYIYNTLGTLLCMDETTLNTIWSTNIFNSFDGEQIMWGITESPLIVDDKIFLTPGSAKYNLVALNKNTGALIWSSKGEGEKSSYCSPQYIGGYSVPIIVTNTLNHIVAFNANTGEKLWSHPLKNKRNIHPNTPIYSNGMLFVTTGYGGGSVMLRLKEGGKSVEQVWKNEEMDNQMGGAVKVGDYVYASGHDNKYWFCVDWKTGETKYKTKEIGECNVISADEMLYCYNNKGDMFLVKPDPEKFVKVSSFKVKYGTDQHWAHPVIHRGVLYIRHGNALMAYKISK